MSREGVDANEDEAGGDAACWAHLVCETCGQVREAGVEHRCESDEGPHTMNGTASSKGSDEQRSPQ